MMFRAKDLVQKELIHFILNSLTMIQNEELLIDSATLSRKDSKDIFSIKFTLDNSEFFMDCEYENGTLSAMHTRTKYSGYIKTHVDLTMNQDMVKEIHNIFMQELDKYIKKCI